MTSTTSTPKVSVVVPVYNPGPYLEDLVSSLLRQSLPPHEFEVLFVDDGSTDESPTRLDELAAAHPHFHVLHIENSGWPSRPRNLGVEAARGEYVFFADHDDWFGDEALERLYDCAARHDADLVVGKMAGRGRGVPRELFRKNRFDATPANSPLIDSLTPHKLFRRSFLAEHELRFPEGRRRLEDHVMIARAFFRSRRTCVLSDYVCYHHVAREDASNAGFRRFDPAGYFTNLREALDVVDAHTEPGPLRDQLHRRWLRNEMVARLRGRQLLDAPDDWLEKFTLEVQAVIRDRFAPGVAAGLPPAQRVVAHLAEQGRVADLRRLAKWETEIRGHPTVHRQKLSGSTLELTISARLRSGDRPVGFTSADGRHLLVLPVDDLPPDLLDSTTRLAKSKLDVIARRRETGEEFFLPAESHTDTAPARAGGGVLHAVHHATARVDFTALNSGRNEGTWELKARITSCGWTKDARLPLTFRCDTDGAPPVPVDGPRSLPVRVGQAALRRVRRLTRR